MQNEKNLFLPDTRNIGVFLTFGCNRCTCGKHRREFDPKSRNWLFWEFVQDLMILNEKGWRLIYRDSAKPFFPCEQETAKQPVLKKEAKEKEKTQPVALVTGIKM
jgi:hypothetical protein